MTIEMSMSHSAFFLGVVSMDWIAALRAKRTIRRCGCASYGYSLPSTASLPKAGWTWMRISLVCWQAIPHLRNDGSLRVGHEMRSHTKRHGAATNDTRYCWPLSKEVRDSITDRLKNEDFVALRST